MLGWGVHGECLMRALLIIAAPEGLEGLALGCSVGRGVPSHRQHGQMETLMASVLLRLAGRNPLQRDAELDEARRKRRQAGDARRCEGWAIVASEPIRQTMLLKQPLEHRPGLGFGRRTRRFQRQKITARRIHHRQGLTTPPITGPEPALVVPGPHGVRPLRLWPRSIAAGPQACPLASADKSMPR